LNSAGVISGSELPASRRLQSGETGAAKQAETRACRENATPEIPETKARLVSEGEDASQADKTRHIESWRVVFPRRQPKSALRPDLTTPPSPARRARGPQDTPHPPCRAVGF